MNIQFQEIQYFPLWVFALVVGIIFHLLLLCRRVPLSLNVAVCVLLAATLTLFTRQNTVVDEQAVHTRFGWLPLIQHTISLEEIKGAKILNFVRVGDIWAVEEEEASVPPFFTGVDQALLLQLNDGSHYFIGSQQVKELEQAIEKARRNGDRK